MNATHALVLIIAAIVLVVAAAIWYRRSRRPVKPDDVTQPPTANDQAAGERKFKHDYRGEDRH